MLTTLTPHLPDGIAVPEELEQAWLWMEQQGWGVETANGYVLAPDAGSRQLGVAFRAFDKSLEPWVFEGVPSGRIAPFAEIGGDGSVGALWLDDDDQVRFVGLGSEGDAYLLADSAIDLLRLVAIGYSELTTYAVGLPPDDDEAVAALAPFRAWVEQTFDVAVPSEWPGLGDDEFTDWLAAVNGEPIDHTPDREPDDSPGVGDLAGDVRTLLAVVGTDDGPGALRTVAELFDLDLPQDATGLRWAAAALRPAGLEVDVQRGVVETIFVQTSGEQSVPPDDLISGVTPSSTMPEVLARFGEPAWQGPSGLRYVVDGRHLHLQFGEGGLELLTLMRTPP